MLLLVAPLRLARVLLAASLVSLAFAEGLACDAPLQMLEVNSKGDVEVLSLAREAAEYLEGLRYPLYVVPMLGVYRGGKSMTLNRLMGLTAPYMGGFGVGHGGGTHSRGISVCAEWVDGVGTIAWMDTEGLFSWEDARSKLGPKIFSLALLTSSLVLLNSKGTFNSDFFDFFGDQQKLAHILKQGLEKQGLPTESMMPDDMKVFWVQSQPTGTWQQGLDNLQGFLKNPKTKEWESKFDHLFYQVPMAVKNVEEFDNLDEVPDDDLRSDYREAIVGFRGEIIMKLQEHGRALRPESMARQLEMYLEVINHESFDPDAAVHVFEDEQLGELCTGFKEEARIFLAEGSQRETDEIAQYLTARRQHVMQSGTAKREEYRLGESWPQRLADCVRQAERRFVVQRWQAAARQAQEEAERCFFLDTIALLDRTYAEIFGDAFLPSAEERESVFAAQRVQLSECVTLGEILRPLAYWLIWPFCSLYMGGNSLIGDLQMMLFQGVLGSAAYVALRAQQFLPPYLDLSFRVLREMPWAIDWLLGVPPWMLEYAGHLVFGFQSLGLARSLWKLLWNGVLGRSKRHAMSKVEGEMQVLELKLNALQKRSEVAFKKELASFALDAAQHIQRGEGTAASVALFKGLLLLRDIVGQDHFLQVMADDDALQQGAEAVRAFRLPPLEASASAADLCAGNSLVEHAATGRWQSLIVEMAQLLQRMQKAEARRPVPQRPQAVPKVQASSPSKVLKDLDGAWQPSSGPAASISGRCVSFSNGTTGLLQMQDGRLSLTYHVQVCTAEATSDGSLKWSNGDCWYRVKALPGEAEALPKDTSPKRKGLMKMFG